jgi:hypothetical protein
VFQVESLDAVGTDPESPTRRARSSGFWSSRPSSNAWSGATARPSTRRRRCRGGPCSHRPGSRRCRLARSLSRRPSRCCTRCPSGASGSRSAPRLALPLPHICLQLFKFPPTNDRVFNHAHIYPLKLEFERKNIYKQYHFCRRLKLITYKEYHSDAFRKYWTLTIDHSSIMPQII